MPLPSWWDVDAVPYRSQVPNVPDSVPRRRSSRPPWRSACGPGSSLLARRRSPSD